jgi:hypothetical protein
MKKKKSLTRRIVLACTIIGLLIILAAHADIAYHLEIKKRPSIEQKILNKDATYLYAFYVSNAPNIDNRVYFGNPSAPITFIYYTDLQCSQCKIFNEQIFPYLKSTYIDTGKGRFIPKIVTSPEELSQKNGNFIYAQSLECINQLSPENGLQWYLDLNAMQNINMTNNLKKYNISQEAFKVCMNKLNTSIILEDSMENDEFGIIVPRLYIGIHGKQNNIFTGFMSNQTIRTALRNKEMLLGD